VAASQEDLDTLTELNRMIHSGVLESDYQGRRIRYRTLDELFRARDDLQTAISKANGGASAPVRLIRIAATNGICA